MAQHTPTPTLIRDENELLAHWTALKPGVSFDQRTLMVCFLTADGIPIPTVVPIEGIPVSPDPVFTSNLSMIVTQAVGGTDLSAILLLSRPGLGSIGKTDRSWAEALRQGIPPDRNPWPLCLLTQERPASVIREA